VSREIELFHEVLIDELESFRRGEMELIGVLPMMWDLAHRPELAMLLRRFLRESCDHATLLGEVQLSLGGTTASRRWAGLAATIEETVSLASSARGPEAKDLALISGMIRIKGLKIAACNVARLLAENLGKNQAKDLMVQILVTEMEGELKLFGIALDLV
jgi:ferritin-like metal-binding protein YciE